MTSVLTAHSRSTSVPWEAWRSALVPAMEQALEHTLRETCPQTLSGPLLEELKAFIRRPGKRVRPLLLLHSYHVFSGREPDADAFRIAAALELLHIFILAHDDVIDGSDTRSGLPTLHRMVETRLGVHHGKERAAKSLAIVLGDVLFAAAQRAVLHSSFPPETRLRALDSLLVTMSDTGLGECDDILFGVWDVGRISSADVEQMYWLKTSRYTIESPLALGAILAGCKDDVLRDLRELSRPLGLAFQIRNDLKAFREFEISDAIVPDDFLEAKKTMLMTTAYEGLGETDRRLLQLCLGQHPVTDAALSTMKELVVKSGAVGSLESKLRQLSADGSAMIDALDWPDEQRRGLCLAMEYLGAVLDCRPVTAGAAA